MVVQEKTIRLKSEIGNWYEYKPQTKKGQVVFEALETEIADELLDLHYKFAQEIVEKIAKDLSFNVDLFSVKVEQMKYSSLLGSIKGNSVSSVIDMGEGIDLMLIWEYKLIMAIVNRLTGGEGLLSDKGEKLSDIETIIAGTFFKNILDIYKKAWINTIEIPVALNVTAPALKENEKIKKDDNVLVFDVSISLKEQEKTNFKIYFSSLNIDNLYEKYLSQKKKKPKKVSIRLSPDSVDNVPVPVEVALGKTTIYMKDIMNLEVDDVFVIDTKLEDRVAMKIGEEAEFVGLLGRKGQQYAVKIDDLKTSLVVEEPQLEEIEEEIKEEEVDQDFEDFEETDILEEEEETEETEGKAEEEDTTDSLLEEFAGEDEEDDDEEFTWDVEDL